jgi:hypothetical protein
MPLGRRVNNDEPGNSQHISNLLKSSPAVMLPGSIFFLLIYISDPPYMNCVLGGFILLCLVGTDPIRHRGVAATMLACSILINVLFYLEFRALPLRINLNAIIDKDWGTYSLYGVKHKCYERLPCRIRPAASTVGRERLPVKGILVISSSIFPPLAGRL